MCTSFPSPSQPCLLTSERRSIAFGDSYTYVQGTGGYPKYSFIGSGLPDQFAFTPEQLLEDRIVQHYNSTAEGGPNWVEYLTGCGLGKSNDTTLPSDCDVQLWDFAFAGADVSDAYLPRHEDYVNPLVNQTQQYLTYAEPVLGPGMDKDAALVAIWIGINDIMDTVDSVPEGDDDYQAFWANETSAVIEQAVQPLHDAGFAHFLLVNLPPMDRTSANQKLAKPRPNRDEVASWNSQLAAQAATWADAHSDATVLVYDANSFLNGVLNDPSTYNITNTANFCSAYDEPDVLENPGKYGCEPLNQYFWFNSGHL